MPHDSSPSWVRPARNVLGIVAGCVSFPVLVTLISASPKPTSGWVLGGFGLLGGAMNAFMLPGQPTWLMMLDVALYLPMGWLGAMLVLRLKGPNV